MSLEGVAAICNLMMQRDLLFKLMEVAKSMWAFLTQRLDSNKELHAQLENAESGLDAAQIAIVDVGRLLKEAKEEREAMKAEACWMKEEKEVVEAKCKETGQERNQLRNEVEELHVASAAQKKELEEI